MELAVLVVQALYTLCCRLSTTVDVLFRLIRSHPLLQAECYSSITRCLGSSGFIRPLSATVDVLFRLIRSHPFLQAEC
jgi:hypothetical protein